MGELVPRDSGAALNDLGDPIRSRVGAFEHAVAIDPGDPTSMFYVAVARAKTRDAAGAQAAALEVKRLTRRAPRSASTRPGSWPSSWATGPMPSASTGSALRLAPTSADFLNNLGLAVLRQGRTHEATELFTQAGALEPTSERLPQQHARSPRAVSHLDPRCGAAPLRRRAARVWLAGWFVLLQVVINLPDPWAAIGLAVIVGAPMIFSVSAAATELPMRQRLRGQRADAVRGAGGHRAAGRDARGSSARSSS